jgi:ArsR family transcriptional regulator
VLFRSPQILQDIAVLPGISHNANIHEFLKQKHIRIPADEADDSEDAADQPAAAATPQSSSLGDAS